MPANLCLAPEAKHSITRWVGLPEFFSLPKAYVSRRRQRSPVGSFLWHVANLLDLA